MNKGLLEILRLLGLFIACIITLHVISLNYRVSELGSKLKVYEELDRIWDAKAYCKKHVKAPHKCHIIVSVEGIK